MNNNYTFLLEAIISNMSDSKLNFEDRIQAILNELTNYYGYEYGIIETFTLESDYKVIYGNNNYLKLDKNTKSNVQKELDILRPFINSAEYFCSNVSKLKDNTNLNLDTKFYLAVTFDNMEVLQEHLYQSNIRISLISNRLIKQQPSRQLFMICNFILRQIYSKLFGSEQRHEAISIGNWKYNAVTKEISWSPGLFSMLGYDDNEKAPNFEEYTKYIYPTDLPIWIKNVVLAINSGIPYDLKYHVYAKNKKDLLFLRTITEIVRDKDNNISEIFGTVLDYTNQKKQTLKNANKHGEIGQTKKCDAPATESHMEFLANISHEIRNPLNAVIGAIELLKDSQSISNEDRDYVDIVSDASNRMLHLINQILDYSKIQNSQIELQNTTFNLYEEIVSIINMFSLIANEKDLDISLDYDIINLPKLFIGDCNKIAQIMQNLLSNAIKFTDQGYISIKVEALQYRENKAKIAISFKDTGIGIEESKQHVIFNKFVQANNQIEKKYGGTGLGLSISNKLADLMNGTIELNTTINIGSVFKFIVELELADNKLVFNNKIPVCNTLIPK